MGSRNGLHDSHMHDMHPSAWRSYDQEPLSSDQDSPAVPKFALDPEVPLETMVALGAADQSDQSESDVTAMIIGDDVLRAKDPGGMDEMQSKQDRTMLQSLRRKQQ